jgi:hypothetical protein
MCGLNADACTQLASDVLAFASPLLIKVLVDWLASPLPTQSSSPAAAGGVCA